MFNGQVEPDLTTQLELESVVQLGLGFGLIVVSTGRLVGLGGTQLSWGRLGWTKLGEVRLG